MSGDIAKLPTTQVCAAPGPDPARRFELGLSENPFPPLPSVLAALHEQMAQANRYPEFLPRRLPRIIADSGRRASRPRWWSARAPPE